MFTNIDNSKGLSNHRIQSIIKDKQGFMWFGTINGLNRYDGYSFKVFVHDPNDTNSISNNAVNYLYEDPEGKIWVQAAYSYNIPGIEMNIYDPETETFSHDHKLFHKGISRQNNRKIITDHFNNIWFVSTTGLYRYSYKDDSVIRLYHIEGDNSSLNSDNMSDLKSDSKGYLWAIDSLGILQKIDPISLKVIFRLDNLNLSNSIYWLFIDSEDDIWIHRVNRGGGIIEYSPSTNKIKRFTVGKYGESLNNEFILNITQDDDGRLWFGADHGGINVYDKVTGKFEYILNNPLNDKSICQNTPRTIYKDDNGIIWIGTFKKGISYYHKNLYKFQLYKKNPENKTSLGYNDVLKFIEDKKGNLWIGTDGGGLIYFDRKQDIFTSYTYNANDPNSISSDIVIGMCLDHKDRLWVGTYYGGLNYFDGKRFHHYRHDTNNPQTIADERIWEIYEDVDHNLWLGTLLAGVDIFNPETGKVIKHLFPSQDNRSVAALSVFTIIGDHNNDLWLATSLGVDFYDRKSGLFTHYIRNPNDSNTLSSQLIFDVLEDSRGLIWAASGNGLNMIDPVSGKIRVFKTENGLPSNYIVTLVEDNTGNLWMGTSNGLSNLKIKEKSPNQYDFVFRNYDESDGLQGLEFNENSVLKTRNGELIFGGGNGFNIFDPTKLEDVNVKSNMVITDFQIFNKSPRINEKFNKRIILTKAINYQKEITLKHSENVFSIEFASLNFFHPETRKYKYIMQGFNEDWLTADANHRKVTYTNLNPGKYTFRVISTNNDGTWSQQEANLIIRVLPPYWKTWWFRILITLFIISLIVLFFFIRLAQLRNQKIHLEKMVAQRTKEVEEKNTTLMEQTSLLNESNTLLEERQQQIIEQSEELQAQKDNLEAANVNLQELNSTKDKFFSIIAHDLKNPFQGIMGFGELLRQEFDIIDNETRKHYIDNILQSARSIYNLLENLLNWAKSQTNQLKVEKVILDLDEIISENVNLLTEVASKKSIKIDVVQNTSRKAEADLHMINTVIRNLLTNAIKFTYPNGKIEISTREVGKMIQIDITDNGIGIASEDLIMLFRVDAQISGKGTEGESGSGLGLILCKEFVEKNGGKIWVKSIPGTGSTFSFTIPTIE